MIPNETCMKTTPISLTTIIISSLIIFVSFQACNPDDTPLYTSKSFQIYPNRVEQGPFLATAIDNKQIISNYSSSGISKDSVWILQKDISAYAQYESNHTLLNAIYNLSIEELEKNLAPDSTFNTGKKWKGVWTRDISYSTILALAFTNPELCMNSLLKKVKNDRIIQDTGTGGSWPISSDRMIWSVAAWEIYKVTGDSDWLRKVYFIIKNSTEDDLNVVWDYQKHLFKGETSFLDWREQTYPKWMDPKDIYNSYSFNTQLVHLKSLEVLIRMGKALSKDVQKYIHISEALKKSIRENFWIPEKKYFGQFIYSNKFPLLCNKSESLGEALSVIWNMTSGKEASNLINNTPKGEFGIPCIYPGIVNIEPYHNQATWPFVQAFWNWAASKTRNMDQLEWGMASILRSSALFLTNKENLLFENGDYKGTAINSDRQLWSVAGCLSLYYRNLLGISITQDELHFDPLIPRQYKGRQTLKGFKYRNATLDIEILGFGDEIASYQVDGVNYQQAIIPKELEGHHKITIKMNNQVKVPQPLSFVNNHLAPETPSISFSDHTLKWNVVPNAIKYKVYQNGELLLETRDTFMSETHFDEQVEFTVQAFDSLQYSSFFSKPLYLYTDKSERFIEAEFFDRKAKNGYVELSTSKNTEFLFRIRAPYDGEYYMDFRYANGNGPINTDNKCAIRSLWARSTYLGSIVFPQRGKNDWNNYGFSNSFKIKMKKGYNIFRITFEDFNQNMNGKINTVRIDKIRIIKIRQTEQK